MTRVSVVSPMAIAMINAMPARNGGAFTSHVRNAVQRGSGEKSIPAWNAHLKFSTAKKLQANQTLPT